ncbi:hypothetical protein NTG1052_180013 [Candidatus Nitrotoga sp. 1052]|nr:hypothetical protein NTG1052_180013 [Candidatus Nitrotoga sp. 1052]
MAEDFRIQGRGGFYDATGTIRDVIQNHLFQVIANFTMEPSAHRDSESIRDEKMKVLKAIAPLEANNVIRGQFRGCTSEVGVAPASKTGTFAALRLDINFLRWQGVPFFVRAGKSFPVTCKEILVRFRRASDAYSDLATTPNHLEKLNNLLDVNSPPLLKSYLCQGAYICGAPAWNSHFNTADLFAMLPISHT